jgi:hypothetical protein
MSDVAAPEKLPLSELLFKPLEGDGERITVGAFVGALGKRGFGLATLAFGLLSALPMPPGVVSLFGIPLILFGLQMMLGRHEPWVPARFSSKDFDKASVRKGLERARPWIRRMESLTRPRLRYLSHGIMERIIGFVILVLGAVIALPGPLTNMPPGVAIVILSVALAQEDGVWILLGLIGAVIAFVIGLSGFILMGAAIWWAFVALF